MSPTAGFCVEALNEALVRFGKPGIFNTDQGAQFTSFEFTQMLRDHGIQISMDGRGRCHDNIFVERLWWTVKHEWVYLRPVADGIEQKRSLRQDFGAAVNASQWHYPMSEMRAALQRLAAADTGDACEGIILEYTNRVTGGPVMPTIACHMQLLRPGEKTKARRRVCCTNYQVVEGTGYSMVGDQRLDWEDKDVFTVPTWTFCEHVNNAVG